MGKGARNERAAVDLYDDAGYWVYRPETTQFGENDLWGLFDLAAISEDVNPRTGVCELALAQVKTNRARGITAWFGEAHLFTRVPGVSTHYLVRHDGHGGPNPTPAAWRLAVPTQDDGDYVWAVDERDGEVDEPGELVTQYLRVSDVLDR